MKFVFYCDGKKKKKEQVIKAKTDSELMLVAKIAKCELTKNQILKDLDFSSGKLMCKVDSDKFTMQELWSLLNKKFSIADKVKSKKDKPKGKKKDKDKKSKKDSSVKKKKKNKKSLKKTNKKEIKPSVSTSRGLIKVTRK